MTERNSLFSPLAGKVRLVVFLFLGAGLAACCDKPAQDALGQPHAVSGTSSGESAAASGRHETPVVAPDAQTGNVGAVGRVRGQKQVSLTYNGVTGTILAAQGHWQLLAAGTRYGLVRSGDWLTCRKGDTDLARGRPGPDGVTFASETGPFLKIRLKPDKVKVYKTDDDPAPIAFKVKPEKIKVVQGEEVLGKVKYYPDTGKMKAKDAAGNEVVLVQGMDRLSSVPAPYLAGERLTDAQRSCLALYLMSVGR